MSVATDDVDVARDRRLVRRCREGESDAFGTLYAVYHDRLVRHCGRRLPDRGAAEDVAQEAFIRAWRAMDRFEIDRPFYPWLQAIASNACTDVLRRHRLTAPLSELRGTAALDHGRGVEEHLTMASDAALANGAMAQLTDRHRRVLHLREQLDWSVQEIAAHEGLEPNAADTLLWRARQALRRRFRALSEGAAALIATGGTLVLSARHRLLHVVHGADVSWAPALRLRTALMTAAVLGAGAASTSSAWVPSHSSRPARDGRATVVAPTVTSARPSGAGATSRAGSTGGTRRRPPDGAGTGSKGTVPTSGSTGGAGAPIVSPVTSVGEGLGSGGLVPTGTAPAGLAPGLSVLGTHAAVGTPGGVAAGVGGTVQAVTSTAGGAVQLIVTSMSVAPVVPPVVQPVVGGVTGAVGPVATPGTGIVGVPGGLAGH